MVSGWVDVHAHYNPPTGPAEDAERLAGLQSAGWAVEEAPRWDVDSTLAFMDRAGMAMQLLSNIPKTVEALRGSNDFGASLVSEHETRFGLLAGLPTDQPEAALEEIDRADRDLGVDGFAVTCRYNGVYLSDPSLERVWDELDRRGAAVFVHPDGYAPASFGRPAPVLEVAFETTRTLVDMLYVGTLRRHPNVRLIVAHGGAALPSLAGRLIANASQPWIPNPEGLDAAEIEAQLARLYLDTAVAGSANMLRPALEVVSSEYLVYGSDCGVPCTNSDQMLANLEQLLAFDGLDHTQLDAIGGNVLELFPAAARRLGRGSFRSGG
jgi:predicted TIM-barrel fold metal-dependent hydrolase